MARRHVSGTLISPNRSAGQHTVKAPACSVHTPHGLARVPSIGKGGQPRRPNVHCPRRALQAACAGLIRTGARTYGARDELSRLHHPQQLRPEGDHSPAARGRHCKLPGTTSAADGDGAAVLGGAATWSGAAEHLQKEVQAGGNARACTGAVAGQRRHIPTDRASVLLARDAAGRHRHGAAIELHPLDKALAQRFV